MGERTDIDTDKCLSEENQDTTYCFQIKKSTTSSGMLHIIRLVPLNWKQIKKMKIPSHGEISFSSRNVRNWSGSFREV